MARSHTRSLVVRLASVLAIVGLIQPGFGSPGNVLEMDVPILGSDASPKTRDLNVGDTSVSTQTGALQYAYPIEVPPGRGGMQPQLSLQYNSQGALTGGLAAQWSLAGIHEIRLDPSQSRLAKQSPDFEARFVSSMAGGHQLIQVTEEHASDVYRTYRAQYDSTYARYEQLDGGVWRVRTTDGVTHYFGEADHLDTETVWRRPITHSEDSFGNRIDYYWKGETLGTSEELDILLDRIEYGRNDAAGLPQHAKVLFHYADPTPTCAGFPVGAREEFSGTGQPRWIGSRRLDAISTHVTTAAGSGWTVRNIALSYDEAAASCNAANHGPLRILTRIQEEAGNYSLPPVTFEYGPLARSFTTALQPWSSRGEPLTGGKTASGDAWPMLEAMLIDFDGDGRIDRLLSDPTDEGCGFVFDRNTGSGFAPQKTQLLPTFRWEEREALPEAICSLAGQRDNMKNWTDPYADCPNQGPQDHYMSYRFLDVIGGDGLPDLVTGFNSGRRFSAGHAEFDCEKTGDCILPPEWRPICADDDGSCPDLDEGVFDDIEETCEVFVDHLQNHYEICHLDQDLINAPLSDSGDVPCASLMMEDAPLPPEPDPHDPPPQCPPNGGPRERKPLKKCGGYVWNIYKNVGGTLSAEPLTIISPIPLDSNVADTGLGGGGLSSTRHAIVDIDGDGYLDILTRDFMDAQSNPDIWYVFRGDGTGHFRSRSDGEPYTYEVPVDAPISRTELDFTADLPGGSTGTGYVMGHTLLMDATGDGLPDLLSDHLQPGGFVSLFTNDGRGFRHGPGGAGLFSWGYGWLSYARTNDAVRSSPSGPFIEGTRESLEQPLDLDGDGRLDRWFYDVKGDGIRMGAGAGVLLPTKVLSAPPLSPQRLEVESGEFRVLRDFLDLDGDGVTDQVEVDGLSFDILTDQKDGKPMRLLNRIDNGAGGITEIRYRASTDRAIDILGTDDTIGMPSHVWLVDTLTRKDQHGSQPDATTTYRYGPPVWNQNDQGRYGFRGFEKVRVISPLGAITGTTYDYDLDWSGRKVKTTIYAGAGQLATIESTAWAKLTLFDGTRGPQLPSSPPITAFVPTTTIYRTCSPGQTETECTSTGARRYETNVWDTLEAYNNPTDSTKLVWYRQSIYRKRAAAYQDGDRVFRTWPACRKLDQCQLES